MTRFHLNAGPSLLAASAALTLMLSAPPGAWAQTDTLTCANNDTFPCGLQIDDAGIRKVPSVFKFQARVSQAKLPIGKGSFSEVIVKVLEGTTTVCQETFQNVEVRESVLNLEIGRNMSCELDEKMARGTSLAFQVCLGSADSCLKPIELGTVPYAVKSSFAHLSQNAHQADESAISHYAFRAAADRDLNLLETLSTGYFDFHSKAGDDGYFMWTPIADPTTHNLTITGKAASTDSVQQLDVLTLDGATTNATGDVFVAGSQTVAGDVAVTQHLSVSGDSQVTGHSRVTGTLDVDGSTTLGALLLVEAGGLQVAAGGLSVSGDATLKHDLDVDGAARFHGGASVDGDLVTMGTLALRPTQAAASFGGYAAFEMGLDDLGNDVLVVGPRAPTNGAFSQLSSVQVEGPIAMNSALTATANAVFEQEARYEGPVVFTGEVDFRDATALLGLEIGGDGSGVVLGNWSFQSDSINHNGVSMLRGTAAAGAVAPELGVLVDLRTDGQLIAAKGLSVLATTPGAQALFMVPASFSQDTVHSGTLRMKFPSGAESELLKPRTNGMLHIDDNRQLAGLVIEASTRFTSNTSVIFEGSLSAQGNLAVSGGLTVQTQLLIGDQWRFGTGNGLEAKTAGGWGRVLSTSGTNAIVLDANGDFPGGTRTGGALETGGKLVANGGMTVRAAGANRFTVDSSLSRFLNKVKVDADLEVDTAGAGGLLVNANGVTMSGTLATVSGSLLVSGSAGFSKGIAGSGQVKTKQGSCQNVVGQCPANTWSAGVVGASSSCGFFFGGCTIVTTNRCCTVELSN